MTRSVPPRNHPIAAPVRLPHILATWACLPVALWWIASFVLIVIFDQFWMIANLEQAITLVGMSASVWIIATALLVVLRRRTFRRVQRDRNRFARQVVDHLMAGGVDPPPFSLYLRPFFTDNQLIDSDGVYSAINLTDPLTMAELGQRRDCERGASNALQACAPLIAIGTPGDALGAGRAQVADEVWFSVIQMLARHAKRLVVVPLAQPSTLQEIRFIAEQPELIDKTVFVRPANRRRLRFMFRNEPGKALGEIWERTRVTLADLLPGFPRFAGGARMFVFKEKDEPRHFYGNSFCSIQSATGVKALLVKGKIVPFGLLPFVAWLPLVALLNVRPDVEYFAPHSLLRPVAEFVMAYTTIVSVLLFWKTMDRPYRAWITYVLLFLGFMLMQVLALSFQICSYELQSSESFVRDGFYSLPPLVHQLLPTPCGQIHLLLMSALKSAIWGAAVGAFWSFVYQRRVLLRTTLIAASGPVFASAISSMGLDAMETGIAREIVVSVMGGVLSGGLMAVGFTFAHVRRMRVLVAALVVGSAVAAAANFAASQLTHAAGRAGRVTDALMNPAMDGLLFGLIGGLAILALPIALMSLDGTLKDRRWAAPLRRSS